jgi:hypothetical protein
LACQSTISHRFGQAPAEDYRDAVRNPTAKRRYIGVLGLSETGDQSDGVLILESLSSRSAQVRRAAVRALRDLKGEGNDQTLGRLVASDVASVAREAASSLLSSRSLSADDLWAEALKSTHVRVRLGVLNLLRTTGKWQLIVTWVDQFNSTFSLASAADCVALLKAMGSFRSRLDSHFARRPEFIPQTESK